MSPLRIPGSAKRLANGSATIDSLCLARTSRAVCDICGRSRNKGNHEACSKQRQAANRKEP